MAYTWDANGNLLYDGSSTYAFDDADRLTAVSYRYNGLGDRLETVTNAITTTRYSLDLAAGLTQVLDDGDFICLYGNGRIAQSGANGIGSCYNQITMKPEFMERRGRIENLDRSFDLAFWQAQAPEARFKAAWDLIVFAHQVKGQDVRQLRLHRTIEDFQRQPR